MTGKAVSAPPAVVVTGLGAVTAWGWGVASLRRGLASGVTAIGPFRRFDSEGFRTHVAAEVPPPPAGLAEIDGWRHLGWAERFAVAAGLEAVGGSELEIPPRRRVGVFFASTAAGIFEGEEWLRERLAGRGGSIRSLVGQDYCGPGDALARALGVRGPVVTLSTACSSATLAIGLGLDALRDGEVEVAIAGGADALCRLTYAGFNALRAVDEGPCRPFRSDRDGMSIGEGAAVLVLEREAEARARGAPLRARLLGSGASCDAFHVTAPATDGSGPALAFEAALADAGLRPDQVSFVNAHGTGTAQNDIAEANALRRVFGERCSRIPVTSTKGSVGHLLGGAGAIEAVAAVLGVESCEVHPTPGGGSTDPELGLDLVSVEPRSDPDFEIAVSDSLAFGGANGVIVVGRVDPP